MDLDGTRVLVLGGTSGIGMATAELAARQGATVVVASSRATSVERALAALPAGARGEVADLTDPAAVRALVAHVGPIDHLVFTAGEALTLLPVAGMDLDAARAAFGLRYFGALAAVSAAADHLRPGGSIVLTTGTAAWRPGPGWSVAASICGAVVSLTRALAVELAPVRVNAVAPGVTRSPLWSAMDDDARAALYAGAGAGVPLGRVGEVDEVARAYVHLMTSTYATGTVVTVDGGSVLA
jgi:NAD(P)-dependent dehydrogenase (short-subunit alcohol dehydrogenase family)